MPDVQNGAQAVQNWNPRLGEGAAEAVLLALAQSEQELPFLIGLSREQRSRLLRPGNRSRSFVADAISLAEQNPVITPRSVDLAALQERTQTKANLGRVEQRLTQFAGKGGRYLDPAGQ